MFYFAFNKVIYSTILVLNRVQTETLSRNRRFCLTKYIEFKSLKQEEYLVEQAKNVTRPA